jgi:hypothetical protein
MLEHERLSAGAILGTHRVTRGTGLVYGEMDEFSLEDAGTYTTGGKP